MTDYRLARPIVVRLLGGALVALGALVLGSGLLVAAGLPPVVLSVSVALAAVAAIGLAVTLGRRPWVVRLDRRGYRVRFLRGAGVPRGAWRDVADAGVRRLAGEPCVVLRRRDGRTTDIPVSLLDIDPDRFLADLRAHLDTERGYRPVDPSRSD